MGNITMASIGQLRLLLASGQAVHRPGTPGDLMLQVAVAAGMKSDAPRMSSSSCGHVGMGLRGCPDATCLHSPLPCIKACVSCAVPRCAGIDIKPLAAAPLDLTDPESHADEAPVLYEAASCEPSIIYQIAGICCARWWFRLWPSGGACHAVRGGRLWVQFSTVAAAGSVFLLLL